MNNTRAEQKTNPSLSRRKFVSTAAASSAFGFQFANHPVFGQEAPSNKLRLAGIGVGGMGYGNMKRCLSEEIVALCDVDSRYSARMQKERPNAAFFTDYREMFESVDDLDGVVIATPDHTHAVITMEAIRRGVNVYCQKPLTHTVKEARLITEAARKAGVQTQLGNQGRSSESIRQMKEWIEDGAIGNVTEVYAWTDRPVGGRSFSTFPVQARPSDEPPVPENLDWDLWLGPAQNRPYHPVYHPGTWRAFLDFGTGPLGDMGCHILDPSFYALDLGFPSSVEGSSSHWEEKVAAETYPRASLVRYHFPARGNRPPVTLNWSDGRLLPWRPKGVSNEVKLPASGALIVGDEGVMMHGSHGAGGLRILPEEKHKAYQAKLPPKTIPRVEGSHEGDWIRACKDGKPASSNFDYGGPLTEMVLLGVLALRVPNQRLEWDEKAMKFNDHETATALVHPPYREGWTL